MDSSRGGPLTTFIMMLPLIVVPAIAMLKPAGQGAGIVSDLLSAATGDAPEAASAPSADPGEEVDPFDAIFGDAEQIDAPATNTPPTDDVDAILFADSQELGGDDLVFPPTASVPENLGSTVAPPVSADDQTAALLKHVNELGAVRTMWFSPDGTSAGFVAFFDAGEGILRYRFEAVADSQPSAIQDVILQVQEWRRTNGR